MKIAIAGPVSTESVAHILGRRREPLPSGYQGAPFLGTLITELLAQGHEVSAFTLDTSLDPDSAAIPFAVGDSFAIHYVPCRRHGYRFNAGHVGRIIDLYGLERRRLEDAICSAAPDVIHAHWTYEFALAALSTKLPTVVTCHDVPWKVMSSKRDLYRLGKYVMARRVFAEARVLTTVSPYMAAQLKGTARCAIAVVPNPLPRELIENDAQSTLRPEASPPKLAMVCNGWSRHKNPQAAIRGFSLVRDKYPSATLTLFGADFAPGGRAQRWSTSHGLAAGIVFVGPVPYARVLKALAGTHALLHSSLEESFGMAVVEAMALGVPVVAGIESGAVPWLLNNGNAGVLTDVRNHNAIAEAAIALLDDEPWRQALADRGGVRARTLCNPAVVADAYLKIYQDALGRVPKPATSPEPDEALGSVRRGSEISR
jgi:L-malate glycosyltransferase